MLPELSDRIVTLFGDDDGSIPRVRPDQVVEVLCVVLDHLVVRLREELVVENAVRELEPVAFFLPQVDLKFKKKKVFILFKLFMFVPLMLTESQATGSLVFFSPKFLTEEFKRQWKNFNLLS